ncbi:hypothetical protein B0H16DRAFT_1480009 [Mycena metata]|uniref:Uncharacterized protein n=1 Tax=Mycena metata TaxID=1033252 RepID=A0AAD7H4L4_9AGAR|nr:hypothetical protein B0H16DRAFT_1480009 [Mycena metata]
MDPATAESSGELTQYAARTSPPLPPLTVSWQVDESYQFGTRRGLEYNVVPGPPGPASVHSQCSSPGIVSPTPTTLEALRTSLNEKEDQVKQAEAEIKVLQATLADLNNDFNDLNARLAADHTTNVDPPLRACPSTAPLLPRPPGVHVHRKTPIIQTHGHRAMTPTAISLPNFGVGNLNCCDPNTQLAEPKRRRSSRSDPDHYRLKQTLLHKYDWTKRAFETVQGAGWQKNAKTVQKGRRFWKFDLEAYTDFWPVRWMLQVYLCRTSIEAKAGITGETESLSGSSKDGGPDSISW